MTNDIAYLKKHLKDNDLNRAIKRLEQGEPVQYIVGDVNFYGNIIKVDQNVLIPRFETEELVYKTINYINKYFNKPIKIVDLGTGSACIAITLKKEFPNFNISAVDISIDALKVAKENAKLNEANINFFAGNMLEPLKGKFDCIISNPPYISADEKIMDIVKNNEPHLALYANNNGLEYYEIILKKAKSYLNDKYLIAFEIGEKQASEIKKIARKYFKESLIKVEKDMQGRNRFLFITSVM